MKFSLTPKPKLLLPPDYVHEVTSQILRAKQRVVLVTLVIFDDKSTKQLFDALIAAADRGVRVEIAADSFTYNEVDGQFKPVNFFGKRYKDAVAMQKRLKSHQIEFHWLGRLGTFAVTGRTHIKWCVVDDTVYSFGGVNLSHKGITNNDYMLRVQNNDLASRLIAEHERIIQADKAGQAYRSHKFGDEQHTVLIDGGLPGDSIIYRRACTLAKQAESILFVSQYCPTGKLSRLLKQKRAVMYFNHWKGAGAANSILIRFNMLISHQKTLYTRPTYLHAKFIIFTMKDGSKVAITGSHNMERAGVIFGTREVALETTDRHIISQLEKFWRHHVR